MTPTSTQSVDVLNESAGSNSSNQDSLSTETLPTSDKAHIDETSSFNASAGSVLSTAGEPAESSSTVALTVDKEGFPQGKCQLLRLYPDN